MRFPFFAQRLLPVAFTMAATGCFLFDPPAVSPAFTPAFTPAPTPHATPWLPQKIMDSHRVSVTTLLEADDAAPIESKVNFPNGIALGPAGALYVSDVTSRVLRVEPTGTLRELAGTASVAGFTDGMGNAARFDLPVGLAVDGSGNILVADAENHSIRKVTPAGLVTTIAGLGVPGHLDAVGLAARFSRPTHLVIDARGSIFVSDWGNPRIRRLDPDGTVTTIAGTGEQGFADGPANQAKFDTPAGLALGPDGSLYVADRENHRIRRIHGGIVTTVAGDGTNGYNDGPAMTAQFGTMNGLVCMRSGDLLVADAFYNCIRRVSVSGQVTTIVGGGTLRQPWSRSDPYGGMAESGFVNGDENTAKFNSPRGITLDASEQNLYVCDSDNDAIRKITFLP